MTMVSGQALSFRRWPSTRATSCLMWCGLALPSGLGCRLSSSDLPDDSAHGGCHARAELTPDLLDRDPVQPTTRLPSIPAGSVAMPVVAWGVADHEGEDS